MKNIYYICRDYQGSITHITNSSGSVVQELSYDAWGRLRNPVNQTAYTPDSVPTPFLGRGYTGHEHLGHYNLQLINMNARLYDPALGRFLSPDPFVQAPDFSQSFNRYSYALNNPLKYTDESGEYAFLDDLTAAIVGGVINWATNGCKFSKEGLSYFGVGFSGGWAFIYGGPLAGGAVTGYGNSAISQGFDEQDKWNSKNVDWRGTVMDGVVGAETSLFGGLMAQKISPFLSQYTSKLGGPVVQDVLNGSLTSGATGFTLTASMVLFNGGTLDEALSKGWSVAKVGWLPVRWMGLFPG